MPRSFHGSICRIFVCASLLSHVHADDIQFGPKDFTYDGAPHCPSVEATVPGVLSLWFDEPSAPDPEITSGPLYSNIPQPLNYSYSSISLAAQNTAGLGDGIRLRPGALTAQSISVTLVTWEKAANWEELAEQNPAGYYHPITISGFKRAANGVLETLFEATENVLIPWRPESLPDGTAYPYNGYAFTATVPLPEPMTLPEEVFLMVSYNTRKAGFHPLNVAGPYDKLNIGVNGARPFVGSDLNATAVLWVTNGIWSYPATGLLINRPMFTVNGSYLPPRGFSTPPTQSGTYDLTATLNLGLAQVSATTRFTIHPAKATVQLEDLLQIPGSGKPVTVSTQPAGLPVRIDYNGTDTPPEYPGEYLVTATVDDRNYTGSASSTLRVGLTMESWISTLPTQASIDAAKEGDQADPDHDGLCNLLEYAFGRNPGQPDTESAGSLEVKPGEMKLTYRRNRFATDLRFIVEASNGLDASGEGWVPAEATEQVVAQNDACDWVQAIVPIPKEETKKFLRIRVAR